eukprot:CAMPEP_0172362530 /NCGR_PEP_ID=MMETSP1060-20121228/6126_1 /TAXON_ID=37318 /ORGANISM="Pseudo-nitzschia pungens, Strain cf. cingulata" /LENGTH=655 /DNA_ID=CAMNT_0013085063 /DNA_START=360 /DNA_END=2327 /DNA_ORIENTATION=+
MPPQDPALASGDWASRDAHLPEQPFDLDAGEQDESDPDDAGRHVPYHGHLSHIPQTDSTTQRPKRSSSSSSSPFWVEFCELDGPPQIALLMVLVALGVGSTIGIVPSLMADRFARLRHGFDDDSTDCSDYSLENRPRACTLGNSDAQAAASLSSLINNVLTFLTASLMGSLSDEWGRKGPLLVGLFSATIPLVCLNAMVAFPSVSPWWYYGTSAAGGCIPWLAIALSALNDVLPHHLRAAGNGLLFAGFLLGMCVSPTLGLLMDRKTLCLLAVAVLLVGVVGTVLWLPESLDDGQAELARERRRELEAAEDRRDRERLATVLRQELEHELEHELEGEDSLLPSSTSSSTSNSHTIGRMLRRRWHTFWWKPSSIGTFLRRFLMRPIQELSILNRDCIFRLLALLALFSGMVNSADQVLLIYYLEEQLDFNPADISLMFLILGIAGIVVQVVLMKPLIDVLGEQKVVALAFLAGAADNFLYGTARTKSMIFVALAISGLATMSFPIISAIKANNVADSEQGRIQGALYSVKALASGVGPAVLQCVYSKTKDHPRGKNGIGSLIGPGTMFLIAGGLLLLAAGLALSLPNDRANSTRHYQHGNGRDADAVSDESSSNSNSSSSNIRNSSDDEPRLGEYRELAAHANDEEEDEERTYGSL